MSETDYDLAQKRRKIHLEVTQNLAPKEKGVEIGKEGKVAWRRA